MIKNLPNDIFWLSDFAMYATIKLNDHIKGRVRRSPGSPSIRGWNVYPAIKNNVTENVVFKLPDVMIDGNLSFKENYHNNIKIFRKWIKENININ